MAETVGDHVLRRLREWGVEQVFAYPGDGINGIVAAFGKADDSPAFIQARHEEMCALQAVGYAKFSGKVGVCMATSGPGAVARSADHRESGSGSCASNPTERGNAKRTGAGVQANYAAADSAALCAAAGGHHAGDQTNRSCR